MENTHSDFISVINSLLLIVDYQSDNVSEIRSGDPLDIKTAIIASAKAASILNVPVVMTSRNEIGCGKVIRELTEIFPAKEVIRREDNATDALTEEKVLRSVRRYNREKLIIAGLMTSESLTETALHAINDNFDVYGLIDACGDTSGERHNYGVQRMLKAGITPITWMSLASEWMNGWADPAMGDMSEETFGKYNVMLTYLSRH